MNPEQQPELTEPTAALVPDAPGHEQIERDVASLYSVVTMVVLGLLMLSAAVNVFIWRQVKVVRGQLAEEQRQIEAYNRADPAVRDLMKRLQSFAAKNPDFQPIMARYAAAPETNAAAKKK